MGYSGRFFYFLKAIKDGQEFVEKIEPDSDKSGAAMRAAPLGLLKDTLDIRHRNQIQAELTHKTEDGVNSALCAALMTHYFYYNKGPKEHLTAYSRPSLVVPSRATGVMSSRTAATLLTKGCG